MGRRGEFSGGGCSKGVRAGRARVLAVEGQGNTLNTRKETCHQFQPLLVGTGSEFGGERCGRQAGLGQQTEKGDVPRHKPD